MAKTGVRKRSWKPLEEGVIQAAKEAEDGKEGPRDPGEGEEDLSAGGGVDDGLSLDGAEGRNDIGGDDATLPLASSGARTQGASS